MKELAEVIRKMKPSISDSSVKVYTSILKNLFYKHHDKDVDMNTDWFSNQDTVMKCLVDKEPKSRKTIYAALIAITGDKNNDKYKTAMMEDSKKYDSNIQKQEKTETQKDNWKSLADVNTIYETMSNKVKSYLNSKQPLDKNEYKKLQHFIVLCLTIGKFIPPRRSLDWCEMKINGPIDKEKDNYIDGNRFVFNVYKTKKYYGKQEVVIPRELKSILTKFIKLNPHEYLLTDTKGQKLNNVKMTQMLNAIFDSKISTSMLRHIYLTDRLKDIPKLTELQNLAKEMGHSVREQLEYIKK